jgi:hypothetical protein
MTPDPDDLDDVDAIADTLADDRGWDPVTAAVLPVRQAVARCPACPWTAIMSGDDDQEIAGFLYAQLLAHTTTHRTR